MVVLSEGMVVLSDEGGYGRTTMFAYGGTERGCSGTEREYGGTERLYCGTERLYGGMVGGGAAQRRPY
eukprot:2658272-Rhodomonas_salina.2